mmetsp:Transcript_24049/g.55541  ORF Transcript_24049/g.55541 Transcript_24049/m.55541 type:complete len:120 (-) Transcript_24049:12-371(-)
MLVSMGITPRRCALLVLALFLQLNHTSCAPAEKKVAQIQEGIRNFIRDNYVKYGQYEMTLGQMKRHLAAKPEIGLTYEDFRTDEWSAIVEDEVDAIANRCQSGEKPIACVDTPRENSEL